MFLDDLSVFSPDLQNGLREEIAMLVGEHELMLKMRRLLRVSNFTGIAVDLDRVGGLSCFTEVERRGSISISMCLDEKAI